MPGVTSPVATVHSTPGVSQGDATHLPTHSSTHQTLLSLSPVQVVSSTTASCCPNTGVYHRQSLSTPSLVSEHAPSVLSHSGRQPDSLIPASTSLAMCTTRVRHSIPELSTSLTNSCPFGDSHTMHASTKPSTVHIAVSKQELVGHESQSETGFGGKGDLCPVPPQVLNSRETHALLAGTCTSAEETPAFLSVSAHTCIEQPSQSTALVAAPLITTHPHSMSIDKQVTSVAASTALPTARTTIPPTTIPVHTMSQPITHTTTSATTVILSDVLSPPSPSLLPVASVSPPALKFDAVSSNPQASDSPPVTTNSAQPQQSILILSQEDSEPSLSLTPPLDDEDGVARLWSGSSGGVDGCTSGLGAPLARGKDSSVSPEGFVVDSDHTSQLLHSAPTLHAEPAPVADEGPDDLEVAVGQSPTDGKSSQSDDGMGEEMVCSGRESVVLDNRRKNEGVTSSVCDFEGPVVKGEIDSLSGSEDSSVADVPLPLSLRPQQHPQQKLNETFASSNNNIDRDSSTSNSEAALHGDVSALGDQGTQAVSSNPQHQDGMYSSIMHFCRAAIISLVMNALYPVCIVSVFTAGVLCIVAYTSFLQSVCRTTAIASSPLLDSDSEGMEDVLSGRGREQQSAANHTSPPSSPLSAGDADDGASGAVGGWSGGKRRQSRDGECQSSPDRYACYSACVYKYQSVYIHV